MLAQRKYLEIQRTRAYHASGKLKTFAKAVFFRNLKNHKLIETAGFAKSISKVKKKHLQMLLRVAFYFSGFVP